MSSIKQVAGRRAAKVYEENRQCAHPGCITVISRYNKHEHCWRHYNPVPRPAQIPSPPKRTAN